MPDGPYKGQTFSMGMLNKMLDYYFECRGWDKETGIPRSEKLNELGLEYVAKELKTLGLLKEDH